MARPPEAARARSPEVGRARSPGAAGAVAARVPKAPRGPTPARPRRACSRCRAAGGASCALLHGAIGAVLIAQRQSETERAALAVSGGLRPHAAAVRRNDAVNDVQAVPASPRVEARLAVLGTASGFENVDVTDISSQDTLAHR